jgi:hypothetical protein
LKTFSQSASFARIVKAPQLELIILPRIEEEAEIYGLELPFTFRKFGELRSGKSRTHLTGNLSKNNQQQSVRGRSSKFYQQDVNYGSRCK